MLLCFWLQVLCCRRTKSDVNMLPSCEQLMPGRPGTLTSYAWLLAYPQTHHVCIYTPQSFQTRDAQTGWDTDQILTAPVWLLVFS
jgi:hypothetical protein